MLGRLILRVADSPALAKRIAKWSRTRKALKRYMPGDGTLQDALDMCQQYLGRGISSGIMHLDAPVTTTAEADAAHKHNMEVLERMKDQNLMADFNVKLSSYGIDLDAGKASDRLEELVAACAKTNHLVWMDMESVPYVDRTLDTFKRIREKYENVGICLQITAMLTDKHLSEELPPISSRRLAPAPAPYRKALSYVSTGAKVLLGLVIVEAVLLLVFAITSAVIVHHSSHDVYFFVRELTYSIVVIENCIFFVYFAFDGVLYENKFEMTAFALTAIVLIGRVCFFFVTERTDVRLATTITTVRVMSLVVMNAALVCQVIVSFLFVRTWKGFGWRVWNQAKSAKLRVVSAFNFLQTWVSMMKVDIQLSVSLLPLSCFFLYAPSDWQFSVAMVVLIVNVIWALFGWQAMKRQSVAGIGIFLGFMAIEPAYILFKIYELFALDGGRYPAVRCSTSIPCPMFAATGIGIIVLRIALVAVTIKCMTQWPDRRSRQQTQLIQPILVDSLGTQRQRTLTIQAL